MDKTFRLQIINPVTKIVKKRVVYFWDVPEEIQRDLLANKFTKRLQAFFGPDWKEKVFADDERATGVNVEVDPDATDFDLEGPEEEIEEVEANKVYIFDVSMFAEDTMFAIKEKIFVTLGIPVYRQHLFYLRGTVHETGGSVYFGEDQYLVDDTNDTHEIRGVMTDNKFNAQQDQLTLRTEETIKSVGEDINEPFYLYDLADYVAKIGVDSLLSDKYVMGLFYRCVVQKYFPVMDARIFQLYLTDESTLRNSYPIISIPREVLAAKYAFQREKALDIYAKPPSEIEKKVEYVYNYLTLTVETQLPGSLLFYVQNIFDSIVCDEDIVYARALADLDGRRYKLTKYYHDLLPEEFANIERMLNELGEYKNHVSVFFYHECPDGESYLSHITFYPDGKYSVLAYGGTRSTTVAKITADYTEDINKIVSYVNANPSTRKDVYMFADYDPEYAGVHHIYVKMVWEHAMDQGQFALVRPLVEDYERAGILLERNNNYAKTADNYMLKIMKGVSRQVERFLFYHAVETRDYYSIMREEDKKRILEHRFAGAIMDILRGITHIEFSIENIEYTSFVNAQTYIMALIRDIMAIPKPKGGTKTYSADAKKKAAELDPDLYDFTLENGTRCARIVQKKSQPVGVFTAKEIKAMDKIPPRTHKFFSYTTGEDLWYQCPTSKPILGFVAEKHPKGFCIPKCKAVQTNGIKNVKISELCMKRETIEKGDLGQIATAANIIKFGKRLDTDRRCYAHPSITKLLKTPRIYLKNLTDSHATMAEQMLETYTAFVGLEVEEVLARLSDGITDELILSIDTNGTPLERIRADLNALEESVLPWMEMLPYFIAKIFGDVIILFQTEILVDNEILHADNSAITMTINSGIDTSKTSAENTVLMCEVRGAIYAIVDVNDNQRLNDKIIGALALGRAQLDKKKVAVFNDYDRLEATTTIHVRYVSGSKITWVICSPNYRAGNSGVQKLETGNSALICVQVHQSFTKKTHKPVKTVYDVFRRKDYKLPAADLIAWLAKVAPGSPPTFICSGNIQEVSKCVFIGARIGEYVFWFSDTKAAALQEILSASKITWQMRVEFASAHYDDVNKAIAAHVGPDMSIYAANARLYYNLHIYSIMKKELFGVLVHYHNAALRAKALKIFKRYRKDGVLLPTSESFPHSSSKLISVVVDVESKKADLDALLYKEEPLLFCSVLAAMTQRDLYAFVYKILAQLIKIVDKAPNGQIRNVEVSGLKYSIAVKDEGGMPQFIIKHDSKSPAGDLGDSLFYQDGRLLVHKPLLPGMIKSIAKELTTETLFLSQINDANIHLVYNHFAFTAHDREKIVIESA